MIYTNAFSARVEHILWWKRTQLALETNAVKMSVRYTLHLIGTVSVLASGLVTKNSTRVLFLVTRPEARMDKSNNTLRTMH